MMSLSNNVLTSIGATVVFAQFPISQFRAVAWFNVGVGVVFILLQLLLRRDGWSNKEMYNSSMMG